MKEWKLMHYRGDARSYQTFLCCRCLKNVECFKADKIHFTVIHSPCLRQEKNDTFASMWLQQQKKKKSKINHSRWGLLCVRFLSFFWLCQGEATTPAVLWIPCCVGRGMGSASIHWLADLAEINDQKGTMGDFCFQDELYWLAPSMLGN